MPLVVWNNADRLPREDGVSRQAELGELINFAIPLITDSRVN